MAVLSHGAVRADLARGRCGERGEQRLLVQLECAGIGRKEYYTEDDLRDVQTELFGKAQYVTPDVLLRAPVIVNGDTPVRWIDSKGSCPLPGFTFASMVERLRHQLARYVELFGPGLVVWQGGFACASTANLPGVRAAAWSLECRCEEERPPASPPSRDVWVRWQ